MSSHIMEVVVEGRLGPELIATLTGFDVEFRDNGQSRIVGAVSDQAKLLGLLDLFAELHIEVVSINPVAPNGLTPKG